ncbi:hypothetical protein M8J77_001420 [Diaphorina citri]|nr:hypothetical protein M8J77_001420 [Diaphorina citri]
MFNNRRALRIHVRGVHTSEETYQCDPCGKTYNTKKYLREHMKRLHMNTELKPTQTKKRPQPNGDKLFKCNLCETGFESERQLAGHRVNCSFFLIKSKQVEPSAEDASNTGNESFVIMPRFGRVVLNKNNANRETKLGKINRDGPPYVCPQCDKVYTKKSSLYMHLSAKHDKIKSEPVVCNECGKSVLHIQHHMRECHLYPEVRPHMCDLCGARFKKSSALKQHRPIHTGEKHICPVCGRGFTQRGDMRKHQRNMHDPANLGKNVKKLDNF